MPALMSVLLGTVASSISGLPISVAARPEQPSARAIEQEGQPETEHSEEGHEEEAEEIIVQGTRTRRRIQDEPIRVEVIVREEIEEKLLMRPGNIGMLVNETPGIRVQVTSPALGFLCNRRPRSITTNLKCLTEFVTYT